LASFLYIVSSLLVGAFLVAVPWMTLWDANYLLQPHPAIRTLLLSAFTRGAVSGLGLVNRSLRVLPAPTVGLFLLGVRVALLGEAEVDERAVPGIAERHTYSGRLALLGDSPATYVYKLVPRRTIVAPSWAATA
jgi:hypothetical protein